MTDSTPRSVGSPEFDGVTGDAVVEAVPEIARRRRRTPLVPAMGVLIVTVAAVLWSLSGDEAIPAEDRPLIADPSLELEPVDPAQEDLIDADRYRTRPTGLVPVRVAVDAGAEGYLGLSRWNGRWYVSSSTDGVDWTIDLESPLIGVPETFRPGRLEGQHHVSLQMREGIYWGRFVSRRTAGASGAVLNLMSEDAQRWERSPEAIPELDRFEFDRVTFGPPSEWVQRWLGGSWFQQSFDGGESFTTIPSLSVSSPWEPLEIAWSSSGVAVLFYDDDFENYRLALTTDARNWETIALRERGRSAVQLIAVGRDAVLLSAVDLAKNPIELVVPLDPE